MTQNILNFAIARLLYGIRSWISDMMPEMSAGVCLLRLVAIGKLWPVDMGLQSFRPKVACCVNPFFAPRPRLNGRAVEGGLIKHVLGPLSS